MKVIIVIDMQNDFLSGALRNTEAMAIAPKMASYLESLGEKYYTIATRDTHSLDYMMTNEGRHLPVIHCVSGTWGWNITDELKNVKFDQIIDKPNFGISSNDWLDALEGIDVEEITLMGVCTDICVVSNALALKTAYPEIKVSCVSNLCAGVTKETHEAALLVMKMCQVDLYEV